MPEIRQDSRVGKNGESNGKKCVRRTWNSVFRSLTRALNTQTRANLRKRDLRIAGESDENQNKTSGNNDVQCCEEGLLPLSRIAESDKKLLSCKLKPIPSIEKFPNSKVTKLQRWNAKHAAPLPMHH
jgi:hypothetical protein